MKAKFKGYIGSKGTYKFTVGKIYDLEELTGLKNLRFRDDLGTYGLLRPGVYYDFEFIDGNGGFVTESECAVMIPEKPGFKYCINGHEVDFIEFDKAQFHVAELDHLGVKCDTIKFEVKFE